MSVLERSALAESPLADLHAIASELGIDGFRRLRKPDLIDAIVARQAGDEETPDREERREEETADRTRRRRGGRARSRDRDREREEAAEAPAAPQEGEVVEGVVELLGNGSGFVRLGPDGAQTDGDVYISAAQVRRCELVSGDRVSGPVRPPRRSERYPSLIRVETINGTPAEEAAGAAVRYDELPAAFPSERFALDSDDPTLHAIEWLTPFGRGSRMTIVGGARAGKTEALRRLAERLATLDDVELSVVLVGVRPEELAEWKDGPAEVVAALSFAASADAQSQALERAIENGKRIAARGRDAVVLVDTLDGVHETAARKALAAARNIVDGGSLTVIATATEPLGGETTVVALDARLTGAGRQPALDLAASGTLRPQLLVGEEAANAIAAARAELA